MPSGSFNKHINNVIVTSLLLARTKVYTHTRERLTALFSGFMYNFNDVNTVSNFIVRMSSRIVTRRIAFNATKMRRKKQLELMFQTIY